LRISEKKSVDALLLEAKWSFHSVVLPNKIRNEPEIEHERKQIEEFDHHDRVVNLQVENVDQHLQNVEQLNNKRGRCLQSH